MPKVSDKTVGRLSLYRRLLGRLATDGIESVYSHELAALAGSTPAQVRRDLMAVGSLGSPTRGYNVSHLADSIGGFLDSDASEGVALIGVGNLGRAILAYFAGRRPRLSIVAAFDNDPAKAGRVIHGCRCYPMEELAAVVAERSIKVAALAVPPQEAQGVTNALVDAGIKGILSFAPVPLRTPRGVYVEDIDMTMSLEKVAFFARQGA